MSILLYFGIDDYDAIEDEGRAQVDKWLKVNKLENISLIQEVDGGGLALSGPAVDETGLISENDLVLLETLKENTFPWKVLETSSQAWETLEKVSAEVAEQEKS